MFDAQHTTERLVGPVRWTGPTEGYCRCPGAALHSTPPGGKDCRVRIDGVPTVYCFHTHCAAAVAAANKELRRALGSPATHHLTPMTASSLRQDQLSEAIAAEMKRREADLHRELRWPYRDILADSPVPVEHRPASDQFRLWLKLWPSHARIWIGDLYSSGKPEHAANFRTVGEWYQLGPTVGSFTCPSSFKAGATARSEENVEKREFLVVESDLLDRDAVGAVFRFLQWRLKYQLHCIVDTAGKSLHGWFTPPPPELAGRLKTALATLGCDPKMFGKSQPVRLPGAMRESKMQKLIWLREAP